NFIVTNNNFREGKVNWELTSELIEKKLTPIVNKQLVITQGFIGESKEHNTITLGREGSDYSAAIFAYGLKANHLTIWKDVDGVMNGDPKKFANTTKIDELSYEQAIEMAYYGATVIHPKTIQPLQNRHIPLYVKSFVNPIGEGTKISTSAKTNKTPIFISKSNQILLSISSKDFSFIVEDNLSSIFNTFAKYHVNINLMQNSAISFSVCIDNKGEIVETLKNELSIHYSIHANENVELLTVMHQNDESIKDVLAERTVLLEQKTRATVQYILQ
ncbi:MAG: aspartate kinase, partial [Bacteroidia bacterium]|nr:aspartate kinase [Bacteroidia bacterium]